jgi:hypothetical protein
MTVGSSSRQGPLQRESAPAILCHSRTVALKSKKGVLTEALLFINDGTKVKTSFCRTKNDGILQPAIRGPAVSSLYLEPIQTTELQRAVAPTIVLILRGHFLRQTANCGNDGFRGIQCNLNPTTN